MSCVMRCGMHCGKAEAGSATEARLATTDHPYGTKNGGKVVQQTKVLPKSRKSIRGDPKEEAPNDRGHRTNHCLNAEPDDRGQQAHNGKEWHKDGSRAV